MSEISGIGGASGLFGGMLEKAAPEKAAGAGFGNILSEAINKVNDVQMGADNRIKNLSLGDDESIHQVMIDMEKASISFELMLEIRNKSVESLQEIMRMQV